MSFCNKNENENGNTVMDSLVVLLCCLCCCVAVSLFRNTVCVEIKPPVDGEDDPEGVSSSMLSVVTLWDKARQQLKFD